MSRRRLRFRLRVVCPVAVLLSWTPCLWARDYYVSPSGRDTNPGTITQPFQTIQQAASVMVAGDTTYIGAGVYRETVRPANSGAPGAPITFRPYGSDSVTVSGADVIPASSWTPSSGSIYRAPMAWDLGEGANQIFLDGQMMIEARWPNTTLDISHPVLALAGGGSYVDDPSGFATGTFTGLDLPSRPVGYWAGASIHFSPFNVTYNQGAGWSWQTGTVVNASTSQLSFTWSRWVTVEVPNPLVPGPKNPLYLSGKLGELDAAGEWFRDSATSALYFWTPAGDNPAVHVVEAKRRQYAFNLNARSFITIQGLGVFAASIGSDSQSQYLVLDGLRAQYVSHYSLIPTRAPQTIGVSDTGILLNGANNVLRNSSIAFSAGNGVAISGSGHRVFNNVVHDADYVGGYPAPIAAAYRPASGVVIAWNTVYNAGRFGILHSAGANSFVNGRILHNDISEYGIQTTDLGCTYTFGSDGGGTEVAYNVCHTATPQNLLMGVYLDFDSSNHVVHHNLVWGPQASLRMNTVSRNNKVYNNTFASSLGGLIVNPGLDGVTQMPGSELKNNIFTTLVGANANSSGAVLQNNILPGTNPQFVSGGYQLLSTSPAVDAGVAIPPYTNGFTGRAPDIGAFESGVPVWKAGGGQGSATIETAAPSIPTLARGSVAVATVPGLTAANGTTVILTDGSGVDRAARVFDVVSNQVRFEIPGDTSPGVALITITSGNGSIFLGSAPILDDVGTNAAGPSGLTATVSGSTVTLSWRGPSSGSLPTAYLIEAGTQSGAVDLGISNTASAATTLVASNVPAGTYYVRVRAQVGGLASAASNEIIVSVGGSCSTLPGAPTGLVSSVTGRAVTLSWQPPIGGCPPTAYIIEAGLSSAASNLAVVPTGSAATTFGATGVAAGTYYVRVRSTNAAGTSAPSNEIVVTVR